MIAKPSQSKSKKTPIVEKVERRLRERWEAIRRAPQYRRAYRDKDLNALKRFGIDADPADAAPVELFDLLKSTHTDYSIDTRKVISGVLPLRETPWENHWRKHRECVLVLDPAVTLEEIREGIEHHLKFRRRYWMRARRIIGKIPLNPVRLDEKYVLPRSEPQWRHPTGADFIAGTVQANGMVRVPAGPAQLALALIVDPLMPLRDIREQTEVLLREWATKRPRATRRWRSIERELRVFDAAQETMQQVGKRLGRRGLASKLGWRQSRVQRAKAHVTGLIGDPAEVALMEHQSVCERCHRVGGWCRTGSALIDLVSGTKRYGRELLLWRPWDEEWQGHRPRAHGRDGDSAIPELPDADGRGAGSEYACPICHKQVSGDQDARENHRQCGEALRAQRQEEASAE